LPYAQDLALDLAQRLSGSRDLEQELVGVLDEALADPELARLAVLDLVEEVVAEELVGERQLDFVGMHALALALGDDGQRIGPLCRVQPT